MEKIIALLDKIWAKDRTRKGQDHIPFFKHRIEEWRRTLQMYNYLPLNAVSELLFENYEDAKAFVKKNYPNGYRLYFASEKVSSEGVFNISTKVLHNLIVLKLPEMFEFLNRDSEVYNKDSNPEHIWGPSIKERFKIEENKLSQELYRTDLKEYLRRLDLIYTIKSEIQANDIENKKKLKALNKELKFK
jgi:hypothetical protein